MIGEQFESTAVPLKPQNFLVNPKYYGDPTPNTSWYTPVDQSREIELLKQIAELAKENAKLWKEIADLRGKK